MMLLLEIIAVYLVALAFLTYLGCGLTRLLLPDVFREHEMLAIPFVGYAAMAVVATYGVKTVLNLEQCLVVLLVAASALNVYVMRKGVIRRVMREDVAVVLTSFTLFLVGIAPLLRYGYLTTIGENWDATEIYIPMAEYLKTYTLHALATAPPNPLVSLLLSPDPYYLAMSPTYFHGILGMILGRDSFPTFPIVMALLGSLEPVAIYLFCSIGLRLGRGASLLAAILLASSGYLLWLTYFNYAMNVGSLFLLPVAIASAIVAFERQDRRSVVFAGLMAATTPLTHHPSFIAYVLVVGTIGLYFLLHSPERMTVLRTSLVMAAIGALLSLPAHIPFLTSFFWQYYSSTGAGIRDFPQLAEIVGLSYFDYMRYGPTGSPVEASPLALVVTIATLLVAALGVLAADPKRRTLFAAMAGIGIVYVLALRFVLNHPYGYLKGVTLFVFMLIAFVIAGLVWLWQSAVRIRKWQTITVRVLVLIFVAMYLVLSWSSLNSIIARYGQQPAYFDQDALRLAELPALLTPAASVYVPGNGNIPPVFMGFAAYFLRDHPVYGDVHTGYFPYTNSPPATGYGYALLPQGTDPASQGLGNWGAVWANSMAKILAPMPMPAHVASANLAERVRFLGYDLTATEARLPTVHPGDRLQLTLFWQALAPMSDGYSVFVHLVDSTGTMHGGVDREPLRGGFPTNRWAVGEQVQDTYELAVPADAQPGRYAIEVGMYLRPALIHLPVIDATGAQSDRIVIPLKVSVTTTASPRHVVGANLGGEVTLIGYDLPKTKLKPGEQLDLTLVWQAQRAIEHDYTVFVHVLDSTGRVVAQRDNQPQSGRYPTSIWDVGERVADRYGIILLPNLPRGEYYIEVGLYLLQTGERLPVLNTAGQPQGDHVLFSPITIE